MPAAHPYDALTPQCVLDALAAAGQFGDGRLLQLNSYENRVFQVYREDGRAVVAKFYRPGRWSDAQILEEHAFALALAHAEVPVIAPLVLEAAGARLAGTPPTLAEAAGFRFSVSPCLAGRAPELEDAATLRWLGRYIGRLHAVGTHGRFETRRRLDGAAIGRDARQRLQALDIVPPAEAPAWWAVVDAALEAAQDAFDAVAAGGPLRLLRLHGDLHAGNVLWREDGPHLVDLDDACTGPAVQDLWMLLGGERRELNALLEGYEQFMDFDDRELALIEPLRTLRMIHHGAWLAERWSDPAFPIAFPWFGTPSYWSQQTIQLREQLEAMAALRR